MTVLDDAQIYVGTYGRYNAGSLFGEWFQLSDYSDIDEFYTACREYHKNEHDPEFMFQDWENIPKRLISECSLSEKFFELRDVMENELDEPQQNAFLVWLDYYGGDLEKADADDLKDKFLNSYMGEYETEKDYAYQYVEECCLDIQDWIKPYFDYEAYARDLFSSGFNLCDGYVFSD